MTDVTDTQGNLVEDRTEYGAVCNQQTVPSGAGIFDTQEAAEQRAEACVRAGHDGIEIFERAVVVRIGPWQSVKKISSGGDTT